MRCVESLDEIRKNMVVLDVYLNGECDEEYFFAIDLVKRGTCFIAVKTENGYQFYPSRFIGYSYNTMDRHNNNYEKHGGKTNVAISQVLNQKLIYDGRLEKEYRRYCEELGFMPNERGAFGVERKYWKW